MSWLWSGPEAVTALRSRDLATILRVYRRVNGVSQEKVAAALGYDKTYISMIENGRRTISDVAGRRHIASVLGLPPHVLGVTDADDADMEMSLRIGASTVRLADVARRCGRVVEAIDELWPLVTLLERRAASGEIESGGRLLLARARLSLGVALGTVLPAERQIAAVRWTGGGLGIARRCGDATVLALARRMYGNELRKAGFLSSAVGQLECAVAMSGDPVERGTAFALLARAAGEQGDAAKFDSAISGCRDLADTNSGQDLLVHPFSIREIELRGLVATGRGRIAVRKLCAASGAPAPAWRVINTVTTASVQVQAGDRSGATETFHEAVREAEGQGLPQQIQRVLRVAGRAALPDVVAAATAALRRVVPHSTVSSAHAGRF